MSSPAQKRVVLPRSERAVPTHAKQVGPIQPQQVISVSVIVKRKNPLNLEALGGRILTPEEFDAEYAADPASFEALRAFAHQHGLTVDEAASSLPRRTMVLRGPARAMEQAFGVQLHDYQETETQRQFHTFTGPVSLPEGPAGLVEAVLGLDARPVAKTHCRFLKDLKKIRPAAAGANPFNPPQVAALYDYPTGVTGAGQTIALIELGGGYTTSDIQTYFSGLGLTPPTVVAVSVDGGTNSPGDPSGADGEVALDIQVAGSIANGARIAVYFAPNTDQGFIDAITTAVHDTTNKPSVVSISWGGPESSWAQTSTTALDDACQSAAALGVTITVAAGDNGSSDGASGNNVDFPASSPHVLACGGTELIGSGTKITSEVVWNDGSQGGATGGGYSTVFPLPSWQTSAGITGSGRGVPDVAGDAAPETGYNILVDGQQEVVGGTSAVAPLWAALIALINQKKGSPVGFVNPSLYADRADFRDITQGNNGTYSAGPGWDACTGLGSPNGTELAGALG
ncbi:MAG TPA: S53 family peptidase [Acidobacteriaceae bacterium]|jgi:kumamolisin|nr:S53 family peptidase [Acidobacteriaceae bacterium]